MKPLNILVFLLIFNTFILLGFLTSEFTGKVTYARISVNITRVIDGDTFVYETGNISQNCRLLGINTPEKKQPYYQEAKDFLAGYENKTLEIESKEKDKYGRVLAYAYYKNELVNKKILEQGLANLYYYGRDEKYPEMEKAEREARNKQLSIWKKSENFGCIELISLKYQEGGERCTNNEKIVLKNNCDKIQAILKDDATHIYNISLDNGISTLNFSCIWNDDGDTLYLGDDSGLLLFYRY